MAPPSWVEVIYVIPLYGFHGGLNLNLSSVGGRSLKKDYYRAEARRYLPDRAKTEAETMRQSRGSKVETEARPCEAEARPNQLKKTASRLPRAEANASRSTTSLHNIYVCALQVNFTAIFCKLIRQVAPPDTRTDRRRPSTMPLYSTVQNESSRHSF